jgi:hypothetical protein
MVKSFKNLGVGERKSFTVKPAIIPNNYQIAYWRGCFDGDGHINFSTDFRVTELTGNEHMLKGFANFIKKENIPSKIRKHKNVYRIRHSKRSYVFLITKLLYSNSNVHLPRKYKIAKEIFQDKFFLLRKNSRKRVLLEVPNS